MQFIGVRKGEIRARDSGQGRQALAVLLALRTGTRRIRWEKEGREGGAFGYQPCSALTECVMLEGPASSPGPCPQGLVQWEEGPFPTPECLLRVGHRGVRHST